MIGLYDRKLLFMEGYSVVEILFFKLEGGLKIYFIYKFCIFVDLRNDKFLVL